MTLSTTDLEQLLSLALAALRANAAGVQVTAQAEVVAAAVLAAVRRWGPGPWRGHAITLYCDNESVGQM